jgi:glycosyltransferase involved in cell wall biosynthesis
MRMADRTPLTIAYRSETDLSDWNARYRGGLVPDLFPHGLHKLEQSGFDVSWASVPDVGTVRKAALALRPPKRGGDGALSIAWDEYSALRMLATAPAGRRATGVIWLSDEITRSAWRRSQASLLARALTAVDLVWVLSSAQIPVLQQLWGSRAPRIEFVPFGIAADFFTPAPLPDRPAVFSLGNDRDRDLPTLLGAFEIVHRERPDVLLRVQTKSAAALPAGVERVPFLSHADLSSMYHDSTVVAVATRPNLHVSGMTAALEAMASARPVVMTRSPGVDDYVSPDAGGVLVRQADPGALAHGILDALEPGASADLGALGRAAVERQFTTDLLAARLGELLA